MKIVDYFRCSEVVATWIESSYHKQTRNHEKLKLSRKPWLWSERERKKSKVNSFVSILLIIKLILKECKKVLEFQKWNENMEGYIIRKIVLFAMAVGMVENVPSAMKSLILERFKIRVLYLSYCHIFFCLVYSPRCSSFAKKIIVTSIKFSKYKVDNINSICLLSGFDEKLSK